MLFDIVLFQIYLSEYGFQDRDGDAIPSLLVKLIFGTNRCGFVEIFVSEALKPPTLSLSFYGF